MFGCWLWRPRRFWRRRLWRPHRPLGCGCLLPIVVLAATFAGLLLLSACARMLLW